MNYEFPIINNISDVLPAIEGRDEIVVAERDGYTIINYTVAFEDTFPDVRDLSGSYERASSCGWPTEAVDDLYGQTTAKIRRECRGMVFDNKTGAILRRPYHKFFNVNERHETQDHRVNLSQSHAILEKLDGSMIAPFNNNGEIIWGTRMCAPDFHEAVNAFVEKNPLYRAFARKMIAYGFTPIFEWYSRKHRIVLDYKEDTLILTAIRSIDSGFYVPYQSMVADAKDFNIPVVRAFEPQTDMKEFLAYVHDLEDVEGFVVRFDDGHMLKLKCHWYVQIHKAKEKILQDRNIVELILEQHLDDVKAHLPTEDRDRLTQFENDFNLAVRDVAANILAEIIDLNQKNIDRKTFATTMAQNLDSYTRPIIFSLWDIDTIGMVEVEDKVRNTIRNNLSKTVKYEAIRDVWFNGVIYNA